MTRQQPLWLAVFILVLFPLASWSQNSLRSSLTQIAIGDAFNETSFKSRTKNGVLTFRGLSIVGNGINDTEYVNRELKSYLTQRATSGDSVKAIQFLNCIIVTPLNFNGLRIREIYFHNSKLKELTFENSKLVRFTSFESEFDVLYGYNSSIEEFSLQLESPFSEERESIRYLSFYNSRFAFFEVTEPGNVGITLNKCSIVAAPDDWDRLYKNTLDSMLQKSSSERCTHRKVFEIFNPSNAYLKILHTTIDSGPVPGAINIDGKFSFCFIENNVFVTNVYLNALVESKFIMLNNQFKESISLHGSQLPPTNSLIDWDGIEGEKLYVPKLTKLDLSAFREYYLIYKATNDEELADKVMYKELVSSYQQLVAIFRSRGDIDYANRCYAEMKDKQIYWLAYAHHNKPTFNSFFRLQLARLIKVYTNHGTDPARSIVISFFVILVFGVFYFFFPSDWDTTSKSELIRRYRDFIEKNEKGYVIPLFKLIGDFSLSMANALTLSLNSFVTLGFGNIPTHGLARYICVIEGFIGWFLLSIFTVSLINQVLF